MSRIVPAGRVVGLDVARCLALLGMIATHTLEPTSADGGATFVQSVAGGRSSALFAVLAGLSMALMSGRTTPLRGRPLLAASAGLAVRAALVGIVGLLLGELDHGVAVILTYYAVLFCLGIPFLALRARSLAVLAVLFALLAPVLGHLVRPALPERTFANPSLGSLADPGQLFSELTFTGYYPAVPWLAYLLAGMAMGRIDLGARRTPAVLVTVGLGVALAAKAVSGFLVGRPGVLGILRDTFTGTLEPGGLANTLDHGLYGSTPTGSWWWLAVSAPHSGTPFDLLHTGGSALLVIGLCLVLGRLAPQVSAVAFGAGAMTLSLYSLHLLLRASTGWPDDTVATFVKHAVDVLVIGAAYRLLGRSGPVERVVALAAGSAAVRSRRISPSPWRSSRGRRTSAPPSSRHP